MKKSLSYNYKICKYCGASYINYFENKCPVCDKERIEILKRHNSYIKALEKRNKEMTKK